jgi:segregation and condensation protein B
MEKHDIQSAVEAVLFASGGPVQVSALLEALGVTELELMPALSELIDSLRFDRRGIQIVRLEDSFQMATNAEFGDYVQAVLAPRKSRPLSQSAIETLSVIAYKQPVTRREIEDIRGVSSDYSLEVLLKRGLIREAGNADRLGHPVLFATTDEFLRCFALESLEQLPKLDENAEFGEIKLPVDEEEKLQAEPTSPAQSDEEPVKELSEESAEST